MGLFVDVEYQGIDLGRRLEMSSVATSEGYLHSPAPMPVGTVLVLDPDVNHELTVRVTRVSEQVSGTERPSGMFIEPTELSSSAQLRWDQWVNRLDSTPEPVVAPAAAAKSTSKPKPEAEPKTTTDLAPKAKTKKKRRRKRKTK